MSEARTVHDLAADWGWMADHDGFLLVGANDCIWGQASIGPRGGVKVSREAWNGWTWRTVSRYVDPATRAFLVERYAPRDLS